MRIATLFCEMMMNSFRQNDVRARRRLFSVTVLIIILFLLDILSGGRLRAQVRIAGAYLYYGGSVVAHLIPGSGILATRHALESQNEALRAQIVALQEKAAKADALQAEIDQLRTLETVAQSDPGITAPIASSMFSSPYGTFSVGAGSADAVAVGDIVVTSGGYVVGRTTSVSAHVSLVQEVFAPGASVEIKLGTASVPAEGRGNGNAHLRVPRGIPIKEGDPITSPLFAGRPVGIVGKVQADPASAYSEVYASLPVNLAAQQFVYILKAQK